MSDFKPTVDLRPKPEPKPEPRPEPRSKPKPEPQPVIREKVAQPKSLPPELEPESRVEQQTISQPAPRRRMSTRNYKGLAILLFAAMIIGAGYRFVYRPWADKPADQPAKWYMVKLTDGETFYGQIRNTGGDPVVIENVYYDYDQMKNASTSPAQAGSAQSGSIRLVKRGKETHGPSGSLDVVRLQVLYMEALAEDSKVLRAITEYEKR